MALDPVDLSLLAGATVLLVEDDPASANVEVKLLRALGCTVHVAASTSEAAALIAEGLRPSIVLLDLDLPDQTGTDLGRALHDADATRVVPIVAVTVSGIAFGQVAARSAGCDGFVRKPADPDAFTRIVASFLRPSWRRSPPRATPPAPIPSMAGRHEAILAAVAKPICVVHPTELTIVYANPRFEQVTGFAVDEVVGLPIAVANPDDVDGTLWMREIVRRQLDAHGDGTFEVPRRKTDGTVFWVQVTASSLHDAELGELWVLVFDDVTERRRADEALRAALARSEVRFARLSEAGVLAIVTADLSGRVLDANDVFIDLLGFGRQEIEAGTVNVIELMGPESRRIHESTRETALARGVIPPAEREFRRKDGTMVPVLVGGAMLDAATYIGFAVDLSEKRRGESELRESHARYDALSRSGMIGIVVTGDDGQLFDANDAFLAMIGYTREDLEAGAISWVRLMPRQHQASSERAIKAIGATGQAAPWEQEYLRKDGTLVPVLVAGARLNATQHITIVADLTESKRGLALLQRTEEQLRQSQKMEAVGRLAGGVAHDFNNLLSVILGYSDMLLTDLAATDPMRDDLGEIRMAANRASELTGQLLTFSRQQVVEPKVVDLNDLVAGMGRMLERVLGEDVELETVPGAALGRVKAAPAHLEQIVMNLVVNARDAMPTGGKLTIETSNVVLDDAYALSHVTAKVGPYVRLTVTDNGCGMSRETQARIFDPFFTTKPVGKGSGLGLSTVFGIVQLSGGHVWVYSEPGKGTSFKIFLPRVDAEVGVEASPAQLGSRHGSETILLVEDEAQVRRVADGILRRHGYDVLVASNAGEALLLCEGHAEAIHLLVTDVVMPQMSGPELARRLAPLHPEMRVLCMSGYTDDSVVRHGVLEDGIPFLQKPLTPDSLTRKVREVLDAPA